jgi:hypothetical protein
VREKGILGRWDMAAGVLAAVLAAVALARSPTEAWAIPLLVAGLLAGVTGLFFTMSPAAPFIPRAWIPEPDWLDWLAPADDASRRERDARLSKGELFEEGADPLFAFECMGAADEVRHTFRVGVRVDSETLKRLRAINRETGGRLFHDKPRAVVLSEGPPAAGLGLETVDRLCWQIVEAGRRAGLTKYMLASSILRLVQKAVKYELDGPSTRRVLGDAEFDEYGRFPVETIHDQTGDCEDTSMLCAALLARCRIPCALIWLSTGPDEGHMAVGLEMNAETIPFDSSLAAGHGSIQGPRGGSSYLYGETATDDDPQGMGFGVVPAEMREKWKVDRVEPIPSA